MKKLYIILLLIIVKALADGFYLRGESDPVMWHTYNVFKTLNHSLVCGWVAVWFWYASTGFRWKDVLIYVGLNFVFFNYIHNIAVFAPDWSRLQYLGSISVIDRVLYLATFGNGIYYIIIQCIVLIIVINLAIPYFWKYLKK